jgi:hypothetical protein
VLDGAVVAVGCGVGVADGATVGATVGLTVGVAVAVAGAVAVGVGLCPRTRVAVGVAAALAGVTCDKAGRGAAQPAAMITIKIPNIILRIIIGN